MGRKKKKALAVQQGTVDKVQLLLEARAEPPDDCRTGTQAQRHERRKHNEEAANQEPLLSRNSTQLVD
jgi:hypothetical protein